MKILLVAAVELPLPSNCLPQGKLVPPGVRETEQAPLNPEEHSISADCFAP